MIIQRLKILLILLTKEICFIENWDFLLRKASISLPKGTSEVKNTINGRILYLFIDNKNMNTAKISKSF